VLHIWVGLSHKPEFIPPAIISHLLHILSIIYLTA
jgi:hypothetical protein